MAMLQQILIVIFIVNCFFLVLLILLQSNRSGGMSLFGGGGGQSAFGSGSGDILTKATGVMATIFLVLGLTIAYLGSNKNSKIQSLEKEFVNESPQKNEQNSNSVNIEKKSTIEKNTVPEKNQKVLAPSNKEPVVK